MTHVEMLRQAAAIIPPAGATQAFAVVDEQQAFRAAFLIGGRFQSKPVGPAFAKPREACAFVGILNGDPASRSESQAPIPAEKRTGGPTRSWSSSSGVSAAQSEAPDGAPGVSGSGPVAAHPAAGARTCLICGRSLPVGSRSHRRTDTAACRRALARAEANDVRADAQGGEALVPLSRGPEGPTSSEAPDGYALSGASRDAGPDPSPGPRELDRPHLGL